MVIQDRARGFRKQSSFRRDATDRLGEKAPGGFPRQNPGVHSYRREPRPIYPQAAKKEGIAALL